MCFVSDMEVDICPLCNEKFENKNPGQTLTEKGVASLKVANEARQDEVLLFEIGQKVHSTCRQKYTHKREIRKYVEGKLNQNDKPSQSAPTLRSSSNQLEFARDCLFCCVTILPDDNMPVHRGKTSQLRTVY